MNCQNFENNVIDIVRRQPMDAAALSQSLAHAAGCARCARQLEEQRSLTTVLRDLSGELKAVTVPDRLEVKLLEAVRASKFQTRRVETASRKWIGAAAIAATFLIVLGAVALRSRPTIMPETQIVASPQKPGVELGVSPQIVSSETPVISTEPLKPIHRPHRVKLRVRAVSISSFVTASASIVPPEITTGFMQLGDDSVANLHDGSQVVRVEMPRYAMARFGLPVNMERYDEKVKADVWMGVDGLARAIRFVQ